MSRAKDSRYAVAVAGCSTGSGAALRGLGCPWAHASTGAWRAAHRTRTRIAEAAPPALLDRRGIRNSSGTAMGRPNHRRGGGELLGDSLAHRLREARYVPFGAVHAQKGQTRLLPAEHQPHRHVVAIHGIGGGG